MSEIKIIKDSGNFHVFLGDTSVWLNATELHQLSQEIYLQTPSFDDGDFLVFEHNEAPNMIVLFHRKTSEGSYHEHASISVDGSDLRYGLHIAATDDDGYNIRRATVAEANLLLEALKEEGKSWNLVLKKIVDASEFSVLKPFDKVLVRDYDGEIWLPKLFARHVDGKSEQYETTDCIGWKQCIKYDDNEDLAFTSDPF